MAAMEGLLVVELTFDGKPRELLFCSAFLPQSCGQPRSEPAGDEAENPFCRWWWWKAVMIFLGVVRGWKSLAATDREGVRASAAHGCKSERKVKTELRLTLTRLI